MIIPSINTDNFEEVQKRIKIVEPFVSWVHLDIADGTFTKNTTWHNAKDLNFFKTSLNIEVHLMIDDIDRRINEWFISSVKRIFFHLNASRNPDFIIEECKKNGIEVGIAISPDESLAKATPYKDKVDAFQILGVHAGPAGQKADEGTFERIKEMRKFCSSCIIEVDGGMNEETVKRSVESGADIIVAASAIFKGDIKKNIEKLKHASY